MSSSYKKGGVIIAPTDTVWGICCDATHDNVIQKIYEIKQRDLTKPLVCLVSSHDMAQYYTGTVRGNLLKHLRQTHRPITVVYTQCSHISQHACSHDGSIALRIVNHGFIHDLCRLFGVAIVAISANFSGYPTP